jgi:hypothetical protein
MFVSESLGILAEYNTYSVTPNTGSAYTTTTIGIAGAYLL